MMGRVLRVTAFGAGLVALGAIGFGIYAWNSEIAPVDPPARASFTPENIARGAELAALGNCNVCHTAPNGEPFAGGLAIPTPFGTIHSTNITPDAATGIGRWSEAAFNRAMRLGVDREGRHLYPAFPYDHFRHVTDEDSRALYAYLMTRRAVAATPPGNALAFPYNMRFLLAGWKALFLRGGELEPDPSRSAEWNRGRYLAEGLGHCGACHTPRNALGAERREARFSGAEVEGWTAYPIDASSPAPVPWTKDSLAAYLSRGFHEVHGISRGSMAPVTANLGSVPAADVQAIAAYVAEGMGQPGPERRARGDAALKAAEQEKAGGSAGRSAGGNGAGAAIYAAACANCHDGRRPVPFGGLNLHLSTAVNGPNPQNIINVTLFGLPGAEGEPSAMMPAYGGVMSEDQLVALVEYLRERFSPLPPWGDTRERVRATLSPDRRITVYRTDGTTPAPPHTGMRKTP